MDRPLKALLVEDSAEDAELVELALRRAGFRVAFRRVDNRADMENALESDEWEVVIADFKMPRFTLDEAIAVLRERELDIPLLIVSATIFEETAIRAMRNGARDFIMKDKLARLAPAVERELREAALRRERKSLEEQVRHNQKMESLGVLAGGVAHDFNNLLVGIMGNSSLLMDMQPPSSPMRGLLEDVLLASQKAADLTRQMLAYAGKGRVRSAPTDLSTLVRDITDLVRTSISRRVRVELRLDGNLPPIEADPTQIQQVVMNLLINGAEAIGDGSGTITVITGVREASPGPANGYYSASGVGPGLYVFLQVVDTGCGMDEATKAKIFEPFFTTKFTGRGLGLAAALGIVRGHRGALKVESEPGKGSAFEILFPAKDGQHLPKPVGPSEPVARRTPASGHILVVDDEELVRKTAKSVLERAGYSVLVAPSGQAALDLFTGLGDQIALVLLDLTMPEMGGEETLASLRKLRPDVEIVLTSGFDEAQCLRRFPPRSVSGFVKKPYTGDSLVDKVRIVLGKRAAAAGLGSTGCGKSL